MAAAIEQRDITAWAAANDIVTAHEPDPSPNRKSDPSHRGDRGAQRNADGSLSRLVT